VEVSLPATTTDIRRWGRCITLILSSRIWPLD